MIRDGKSDILWHNSSTGAALVWELSGTSKLVSGSPGGLSTAWQVVPPDNTGDILAVGT